MRIPLRFTPYIFVVLLAVMVLSGWLGSRGLNEPDEGRFAEISREMSLQTDWLIPHLNGVPHFQKPPLTYWITAGFIRLFGANEWAVRLTPALAAFGTVLCTMFIAGALFGASCRWKAGLILITSLLFFGLARVITTDMLLTFWITAAVAGLVGYMQYGRKGWLGLFYMAMGLGFLTKGPLGVLIPAVVGGSIQIGQWRQHKPVVRLFWWAGIPVALLIGFSWYLAMVQRDRSLFDYFFRYEFIDRLATNTHNRAKPFWFYPGTLTLGLMPWTGFAVFMLWDIWQRRREFTRTHLGLFIGWIVVPYVVLSLVNSKLATYLLPLIPPIAIVLARWFDHPKLNDRWRRPARFTVWVLSFMLLAIPAFVLIFDENRLPHEPLPIVFLIAIILAITSFLFLGFALVKGLSLTGFFFWMTFTWAFVLLTAVTQADTLMRGGNASLRKATDCIRRMDPGATATVFVYGTRSNSVEFYLRHFVSRGYDKSDVVFPLEGELLQRIVHNESKTVHDLCEVPAFIIVKEDRFLNDAQFRGWRVLIHAGKSVLLANRYSPVFASHNEIRRVSKAGSTVEPSLP